MVIKFCGQETICTKAVKGSDFVQAYNGDNLVLEIKKLSNMSLVELDGGNWTEPEPTAENRILVLEEQLVQADETAIALYEAQEAQEVINAQQDEALMELYEMKS